MNVLDLVKERPVGWTVVSFGAGAACAVAVLGVPALWTAEAAGWASAITTSGAVVVALVTAHRQLDHAREAVVAERETAMLVQQREWDAAERDRGLTTTRLAFAFARELSYARRRLATRLLEWEPNRIVRGDRGVIEQFAAHSPLGELELIRSFANRLEGFSDEDTFVILTVMSTWTFFNGPPATTVDELLNVDDATRGEIARGRLRFGFDLMDTVDSAINTLAKYYADHPSIIGAVSQEAPDSAQAVLRRIREAL